MGVGLSYWTSGAMSARPSVLLILAAFVACGGDATAPGTPAVGSVSVAPAEAAVVRGGRIQLRATVLDVNGRELRDRTPTWTTSASGTVVGLLPGGRVQGVELGGPIAVRAAFETHSDSALVSVLTTGSVPLDEMLTGIDDYVRFTLANSIAQIPLNPTQAAVIQTKIDMLERPELSSEVVRGRYLERELGSAERVVPAAALFAADTMQPRVQAALDELEQALPVLESFMGAQLRSPDIRLWYGFGVGSRGGGGTLDMEDQGTYEARTAANRLLPYFAIVVHELAHSWIGHEALNQFLELYGYNVPRSGSTDVNDWSHTRRYAAGDPANTGIHAILDIYRILGHEAMAEAYRALHALHPSYGEPLSPAARAAFIDRAPSDRQSEVAALVARIDP